VASDADDEEAATLPKAVQRSPKAPKPAVRAAQKRLDLDDETKVAPRRLRRTAEEQVLEQAKKLEQRAAKIDPVVVVKKVVIADKSSSEEKADAASTKSPKTPKTQAKSPTKPAVPAATTSLRKQQLARVAESQDDTRLRIA
jgi:hypothetical protein